MPNEIFEKINEMSGGGFIFFILDEEGVPVVYEIYDSTAYESLVKSFALDWLQAEREARREMLKNEIMFSNEEEFDTEDEDDDEGEGY
jgi:hypothetical protein